MHVPAADMYLSSRTVHPCHYQDISGGFWLDAGNPLLCILHLHTLTAKSAASLYSSIVGILHAQAVSVAGDNSLQGCVPTGCRTRHTFSGDTYSCSNIDFVWV